MDDQGQAEDQQRMRTLAEFRYTLRQFLQFSERCAIDAGLQPQQHQLMLQLVGAPAGVDTTVSYIAERLGIQHNSAVELSKRCELAGLVKREQVSEDLRRVALKVTPAGHRIIRRLSEAHERELSERVPGLISSLTAIRRRVESTKAQKVN